MSHRKSQNFSFLSMSKVKMGHILQNSKSGQQIFRKLNSKWQTTTILIKNIEKNFGGNFAYFCLKLKAEIAAETFILHSGQKSTSLVVHFCKYF